MMNYRDDLLRAFHISVQDLEANRVGRLGAAQQRNLLRSGNWNLAGAVLICLVLGAILYGVASKPLVPIQWILAVAMGAAVLATGFVYFRRTRAAVAEDRVECLVGPVRVGSRGRSGSYLSVSGQVFPLPVRLSYIQQGAAYQVYIAPGTRSIVAMEAAGSARQ